MRSIAALLIAAAVTIALGVTEVDIFGHNLSGTPLVAVVVLPVADLQTPLHHSHAALGEVFADEFSGLAPCNDVDEVRRFFAGLLVLEVTIHRQGEACHGKAGLRTAQFGIAGQATHDDDFIQHRS